MVTATEQKAKRSVAQPRFDAGLTARALAIAVGLTLLAGLWIRQAEIVVLSTQISESVPAIPGLAALVLLLPVNALLHRLPRVRPLSRAELLVIFLFVTISSTMMGVGVMRFLFALLGTPFYLPAGGMPQIQEHLPRWLVPHDAEAMRQLYERSPTGEVPWHLWWPPGLVWLGFFAALWWTLYCLMALFFRAWSEEERLSFPLVSLPLEVTGGETAGTPFFRNPIMWLGFSAAAVYNLFNVLHALYPSFPEIGKQADFTPLFPSPPWSAVAPLTFHFRPELIGLGYLVATDISLAVWLSFLVLKLTAVLGVSHGYPAGWPYPQEQGIGAYLVLAILLAWYSRQHLGRAWRAAVAGDSPPAGFLGYRGIFLGLFGGFAVVWGFATAAGMGAWVALVFLGIILAVALVYGRLRAEVGAPLIWLFPYAMQKHVLLYTFGSQPFAASGPSTLPVWALFTFLARGYFPAMTGYQVEAMELARRTRINPRRIALALFLAVVVGFVVGWYHHLTPYYLHGAQNLRGGIWGTAVAVSEYQAALQYASLPKLPEPLRIWATGAGGTIALALSLLRVWFVSFPLHPLGYAMTCSYGTLIWGSFFIVWLLKSLVLRYGGINLYRQTVPFFLGLAFGHFAVAGILWGLTGVWTGDAVRGYPVYFG